MIYPDEKKKKKEEEEEICLKIKSTFKSLKELGRRYLIY
jgi:hypothetical protein